MKFRKRAETESAPTAPSFVGLSHSCNFPSTTDGLHTGSHVVLFNTDNKRIEVEVTQVVEEDRYRGKILSDTDDDSVVDFQESHIFHYLTD